MWESYKRFTKKYVGEGINPLRPISTVLRMCFYAPIWCIGSMFYLTAAALWFGAKVMIAVFRGLAHLIAYLVRLICAKVNHRPAPPPPKLTAPILKGDVDGMTGVEFEEHVAAKLRRRGFTNVTMTPTTGDYGVDIMARRGGKLYAIQCKRYSGSVGVHAVQEVFSGSKKYKADRAAVVTNSCYTPNAKEMADDLGVSLWTLEMLDAVLD